MQIHSAPLEVKAAPVDGEGLFTAIAASFGRVDRQGDTIWPGAFASTLSSWQERKAKIPLLWHHDLMEPIGAVVSATESVDGLAVRGKLAIAGSANARRAYDLMKCGGLSLSIGYAVPSGGASLRADGVRNLKVVDLLEISAVSVPADPYAVVHEVKSMSERELDELLRERLGLSRRESKRLLTGGYSALHSSTNENDPSLELAVVRKHLAELAHEILKG